MNYIEDDELREPHSEDDFRDIAEIRFTALDIVLGAVVMLVLCFSVWGLSELLK